jgi:hypothetical protein
MSTLQKIKSLAFLICFVVAAFIYNSISKEKEIAINAVKTDQKNTKNLVDSEKGSVTTINFE